MKALSLAARYRPQTFAEVAGQDMVKTVLSRASAGDRVAAAYLFSGTRGVGKTTLARIFAKALNCEHAPTAEPCNECAQCRKITQGSHVDVAEIDGASNNSVEDARALRETIGYAPMEGRYKVFIIDEAHMLSRSAFNALLKTLEEPPARVVFIFATTEAHKFPITIVSRCQHLVFRHLSEEALAAHLTGVLRREGLEFEEGAVRILARRAAGSVRDSMSLLDQVLALGGERLTADTTRQVLGLAGLEMFQALFEAVLGGDCAALPALCRTLLQRGVDVGFFVRELSQRLRDLFLLRQGGPGIAPHLNLPEDEAALWQGLSPRFTPGHLHAAEHYPESRSGDGAGVAAAEHGVAAAAAAAGESRSWPATPIRAVRVRAVRPASDTGPAGSDPNPDAAPCSGFWSGPCPDPDTDPGGGTASGGSASRAVRISAA